MLNGMVMNGMTMTGVRIGIGSLDDWSGDWSWFEDDWSYWSDDWSWVLRTGGVLSSRMRLHRQVRKALRMSRRIPPRVSHRRMFRL